MNNNYMNRNIPIDMNNYYHSGIRNNDSTYNINPYDMNTPRFNDISNQEEFNNPQTNGNRINYNIHNQRNEKENFGQDYNKINDMYNGKQRSNENSNDLN
ncbi:hypothetical protein BCR36DRAFT_29547 [Piromyces finnis]|uniref:Uncharacterized protein n=1 Tax=Piromyces finnis TaxID=1754191 RepID=A0A1Y1VD46_9FUNG|nr:hypothetical protein BCR36DRAFT_29547 [Piromyces finnis]|eukprot:ORX53029.1 hypothetical protein BCR36DRAFT_29547 [Piromyces finnis]